MQTKKLIPQNKIQDRLKEIAKEINESFDEVTLLITLTGGVFTAIDLSKYITIPCKFEFVKISSYGHEQEAGLVELKWISAQKGSHLGNVIIIDDIYDTGNTMNYLVKYIKTNFTYASLKTMVLLNKPARRQVEMNLDYIGFTIDNLFVYGYGLDLKDYERNILDILYVEE